MTLDQIMFRLCDKELLKQPVGQRTQKASSDAVLGLIESDKNGQVKARTSDGKVVKLKSTGKSKAQMIAEQKKKEQSKGN